MTPCAPHRHGNIRTLLAVDDSDEFRRLRRAIEKSGGDRERAVRNVARMYAVKNLDALPPGIMAAAVALIARL